MPIRSFLRFGLQVQSERLLQDRSTETRTELEGGGPERTTLATSRQNTFLNVTLFGARWKGHYLGSSPSAPIILPIR